MLKIVLEKPKHSKGCQNSENTWAFRRAKMRTALDVIKRIQWDDALPPELFTIGYLDRFLGVVVSFYLLKKRNPSFFAESFPFTGGSVWKIFSLVWPGLCGRRWRGFGHPPAPDPVLQVSGHQSLGQALKNRHDFREHFSPRPRHQRSLDQNWCRVS